MRCLALRARGTPTNARRARGRASSCRREIMVDGSEHYVETEAERNGGQGPNQSVPARSCSGPMPAVVCASTR